VVTGMEVVDTIEGADTDGRDKPREDAVIESVELSE
jgi:cyclophilin family peptidyl-prolyl cis-trans isomerase